MTFGDFVEAMQQMLTQQATAKNYALTLDGKNQLYESVQSMVGGHQHAAGEVVYKMQRFLSPGARGGNVEDVIKAACWCFLIAKHANA